MKKVFFLFMIAFSLKSMGQTEMFDIIHYTAPKDWKKESRQGVVIYTHINAGTGGFCIIAIYASSSSAGNEQKDFTNAWKTRVMAPYQAAANPKTETQTGPNGWKGIAGAAAIKQDGMDAYVILTVFSGFGRTTSMLVNLNDQSYLAQVDSLIGNIKLDKTSSLTTVTNEEKNVVSNENNVTAEKLGHLAYNSLKGWKLTKYETEAVFTPLDILPSQYLEVRIMPSKPFTGTVQQALAESWNDALKELDATKIYDGSPYAIETEKTSYKGWDYIRGRGVFHANGNKTDKYDLRLFVVKLNNRIERIAAWGLMNISQGDVSPCANPLYENAIEELFFTLKFDDWKEADFKRGSLKGEGIIGLYEGLKLGGGTLNAAFTVFFSNGQVFSGPKFPIEGFYGLNTWVESELRAKYWGTYSLQDGKGMINMGYGNIPIKLSGNDIIATTQNKEHKYVKVPSVDGAVFNGVYAFTGDSKSWGKTPPSITFTTDGKFIDKGVLDILHHTTMDPFNITKEPGSGTYEVKDFTMVFNYADGRRVQVVFTGEGYDKKNSSPPSLTLSFNNDIIYKK